MQKRTVGSLALVSILVLPLCGLPTTRLGAQQARSSTESAVVKPTPAAASAATPVPALVPYSSTGAGADGTPISGEVPATFLIFKDERGGEPLFTETQTVGFDAAGHYAVQLGATLSMGIPITLFGTGEARWLEVQIAGGRVEPRVLLVSVPYALKAGDATTLGGLPASAYALAGGTGLQSTTSLQTAGVHTDTATAVTTTGGTSGYLPVFNGGSTVVDSLLFQSSSGVGIGDTPSASYALDVNGNVILRGVASLPNNGPGTPSAGTDSFPLLFSASAYNSSAGADYTPAYSLQAEPTGNNTSAPGATLNVLYNANANGNNGPSVETGLSFNPNGTINFASGQTFPGTGAGVIGTGAPTQNGTPGETYSDPTINASLVTPEPDTWKMSPHSLYWTNLRTGAISPVASVGNLRVDPVTGVSGISSYEMNEAAGTGTVADDWGSNTITLTQSYPTQTGHGLSFASPGYFPVSNTLFSNNYEYFACTTVPAGNYGWQNPTILGTSSNGGVSFTFDHNSTPSMANYQQLVEQETQINTRYTPAGPAACVMLDMNGNTANSQQLWEGTVKVPMNAQGTNYTFANVVAGTGYGGNQDGSTQKSFLGTYYKLKVVGGHASDEYNQYQLAYMISQLQAARISMGTGPASGTNGPVIDYDGTSITAGVNAQANKEGGAPGYLAVDYPNTPTIINGGVGSAKLCGSVVGQSILGNMQANLPFISALYPGLPKVEILDDAGTNDFAGNSTAAAVYACLQQAVNLAHKYGFKVLYNTVMQRGSLTAAQSLQVPIYNQLVLATPYADRVIDVSSDLRFQYPCQNAQFFSTDCTHPRDAGYAVRAGMEKTALNAMEITNAQSVYTDAFSATPNFDLSLSLHHTLPLSGTVTYFTVSNYIPGTEFTLDFREPAAGSAYAVPYPSSTMGSGATATVAQSGSTLTMTLGSGGNGFYKANYLPIFVPQATCSTTLGRWTPALGSGNVSSLAATTAAAGCTGVSNSAALVVSTEPNWIGSPTMPTTSTVSGSTVSLRCRVDATSANVICGNAP